MSDWMHIGGVAALLVFEYWLGKTDKIKPASTLELILTGLAKILSVVLTPYKRG